jgi:hypothetical protein
MSSIIKIRRSDTQGSVPSSLDVGEIAVNLFDRKLYVGNTASGVTAIGGEDFRLTVDEASVNGEGAYLKLMGDSVLSTNSVFLAAGEGLDVTLESNGSITFSAEDATASNKGIASFSSDNFGVTSGSVSIKDGGIVTAELADDAVTNAKLAADAVDSDQIVDGSIDTVHIGDSQITTAKIADSAVTTAKIADNSVTLGTKTTGSYISTISGTSNEVEVSGSGSESAAVTIGLPDDVIIGNNLDVTNDLQVGGDVTIDGNLNVEGAVTYISSSTVNVDDSAIKLAANNSGDAVDVGMYGMYLDGATAKYSGWFRDASDSGVIKFYTGSETEPTTTVDTTATGFALAQVDAIIDGGTY